MISKERRKQILLILILFPLTVGFRVFPGGNNWPVTAADPTLWIKSCKTLTFTTTGFPAGDPLQNILPTYTEALQSIIDDYNNISGSFIRLALYPADPDNPGTPATGDSTFTKTKAENRTIDLCYNTQAFTSGQALPKWREDGLVIGCKIELNEALMTHSELFVRVLTHELGHCLGLDHPQETSHAIMSYYGDATRLMIDDKMGLVQLYPTEAKFAHEHPTLGLSCSAGD